MTGVDSSEIILLLIIGLIVLGPKRLPEIASKVGGWLGQARRMTRVMKRQLEEELSIEDSPSIQPPAPVATTSPADAPDPADPAYDDPAEEPEQHIPRDDDSYSPLHDEASEDEAEQEKTA